MIIILLVKIEIEPSVFFPLCLNILTYYAFSCSLVLMLIYLSFCKNFSEKLEQVSIDFPLDIIDHYTEEER